MANCSLWLSMATSSKSACFYDQEPRRPGLLERMCFCGSFAAASVNYDIEVRGGIQLDASHPITDTCFSLNSETNINSTLLYIQMFLKYFIEISIVTMGFLVTPRSQFSFWLDVPLLDFG